ncbi:hypothetical protein ACGFNU_21210 [Spirillospora sp. NPDC048911]|uniref:hypothetical protein n=1 Tax=Spirillospora sp. NPDC048911 TaxID=3364527 RepID=UPI0037129686
MQQHTAQQIERGPATGRWVYACSGRRTWYVECCRDPYFEILQLPDDERDTSPLWEQVGHATRDEAYGHMRAILLAQLDLDGVLTDWRGCKAPVAEGRCDVPTKRIATLPSIYFLKPLCDEHRTREVVESMWDGPGDSFTSG